MEKPKPHEIVPNVFFRLREMSHNPQYPPERRQAFLNVAMNLFGRMYPAEKAEVARRWELLNGKTS